jgi:hypothetical protein
MNVFKVFASGKNKFGENYMSAFLGWLLSPNMEHGLGSIFLDKLISGIATQLDDTDLKDSVSYLSQVSGFRGYGLDEDENERRNIGIALEYNPGRRPIDILLTIDNYCIAIENKIYIGSAKDEKQLVEQYEELKEKLKQNQINGDKTSSQTNETQKIVMIFLVPGYSDFQKLHIVRTFENLIISDHDQIDQKAMISWKNDDDDSYVSISRIIREVLEEEANGKIDPINEYTRHTLKACLNFIANDFKGYYFDSPKTSTGESLYTGQYTFDQLIAEDFSSKPDEIFIGFTGGIEKLIKTDTEVLKNRVYVYSDSNKNWVDAISIQKVLRWLIKEEGSAKEIKWPENKYYPIKVIKRICQETSDKYYIGFIGGKKRIQRDIEEDKEKYQTTKTLKIRSNLENTKKESWISSNEFLDILKQNGL